MTPEPLSPTRKRNRNIRALVFGIVVILLLVAEEKLQLREVLTSILSWSKEQGTLGALVFGLVYMTATILLVPGTILTLAGAAIYGLFWGTILISVSSTLGAGLAFLVSRYLARDWVYARIAHYPRLAAVDEIISEDAWKIVFLSRLSPLFPYNILNYFFGITRVSFSSYLFASWLGMIPGTFLYVYLGSLAGEVASVNGEKSNIEWLASAVGLLATIVLTALLSIRANSAFKKRLGETKDRGK